MSGDDFVNVRLTAEGERVAPVQVHAGRHSFVFAAGETQRVTRALEWNAILSQTTQHGVHLFELATEAEDDAHDVTNFAGIPHPPYEGEEGA